MIQFWHLPLQNLSHNFRSFPLQKSWMHMMEFQQSALEVFGKSDFYSAGLCYKRSKRDREESFGFVSWRSKGILKQR